VLDAVTLLVHGRHDDGSRVEDAAASGCQLDERKKIASEISG